MSRRRSNRRNSWVRLLTSQCRVAASADCATRSSDRASSTRIWATVRRSRRSLTAVSRSAAIARSVSRVVMSAVKPGLGRATSLSDPAGIIPAMAYLASEGQPHPARENVEVYVRTYNTLLRSSGETKIRVLEQTHIGMGSSLHPKAGDPEVDAGAFIYALQRLPPCMMSVRRVILG